MYMPPSNTKDLVYLWPANHSCVSGFGSWAPGSGPCSRNSPTSLNQNRQTDHGCREQRAWHTRGKKMSSLHWEGTVACERYLDHRLPFCCGRPSLKFPKEALVGKLVRKMHSVKCHTDCVLDPCKCEYSGVHRKRCLLEAGAPCRVYIPG